MCNKTSEGWTWDFMNGHCISPFSVSYSRVDLYILYVRNWRIYVFFFKKKRGNVHGGMANTTDNNKDSYHQTLNKYWYHLLPWCLPMVGLMSVYNMMYRHWHSVCFGIFLFHSMHDWDSNNLLKIIRPMSDSDWQQDSQILLNLPFIITQYYI